jgi:hypothetical protein
MEKTLPELLASVLTNETPLALILMLIKSSGPATKMNSPNLIKEQIN